MKHLVIFLYVCLGIFLALLAFVAYSMDDTLRYQSSRIDNKVNVIVGKSNRGMSE